YAWGDGVLVSRGEPDVQTAGHVRWVSYATPDEVVAWTTAHRHQLGGVVATEAVAARVAISDDLRVEPGEAHRARLGSPADHALMAFLSNV
ncbi:MAG: hypothetical protein AAFN13_17810, partial [Bacteroidota bacterium]